MADAAWVSRVGDLAKNFKQGKWGSHESVSFLENSLPLPYLLLAYSPRSTIEPPWNISSLAKLTSMGMSLVIPL